MANHERVLKATYDQIWQNTLSREELKAEDIARSVATLVDGDGNPYSGEGLALQILLGESRNVISLKKKITSLQDGIKSLTPGVRLYVSPQSSLHITVFPFYTSTDQVKKVPSQEDLAKIIEDIKKRNRFNIDFERLSLSKGDFIIEGLIHDNSLLSIRQMVRKQTQSEAEPPVLAHISIARILQPLDKRDYTIYKDFTISNRVFSPTYNFSVDKIGLVRHFDSMSERSQKVEMPLQNHE